MKRLMSLAALGVVLACGTAAAQQVNVKIGVLTDMSSLYADATGIGSVIAARMAAADFMKDHPNVKVEVVSGDHQNKPDIGSQIANQWYDVDHVDMIADVPNSGVRSQSPRFPVRRTRSLSPPVLQVRISPDRNAMPTWCIGPTTRGCWRMARARLW